MKKLISLFLVSIFVLLSGCSLLEDANDTINYIKETTNYIGEAKTFANEVPGLVDQAINEANVEELETSLVTMKEEIQKFKELTPPDIAADLHQQVEEHSLKLEEGINLYLENIKNGKIDPKLFENMQIVETINEMTSILDEIKNLGQ